MKNDSPRVFLDTNVWFSAFYGSFYCEKLFQAHISGKIIGVASEQVFTELVRNITKKIPNAISFVEQYMQLSPPELLLDALAIPIFIKNNVDSKDQIILSSAREAAVDIFVTGNIKDFNREKLKKKLNFPILTPKEAVEFLHISSD